VAATGGTTRDWIEATIELDGFPITLVDTAGTSESSDWLDCVAIETGRGRSDAADLLIGLVDGQSDDVMDQLRALRERVASRPIVLGVNKCEPMWDRLSSRSMTDWKACPTPWAGFDGRLVELSALDGSGVSDLVCAVRHDLGIERLGDESLTLFSDRQARVVLAALSDDSPACEVAACLRQAILDR
jgi:tRNA modification GTPase